jgi:hypothetical protein
MAFDMGIGSVVGGVLNFLGQKDTNTKNVELGREQMAFQERLSGSSYQRAVNDMELAGLNPMLAYSQGGASTPSGAMPQVQNEIGAGVSGAQQAIGVIQGMQQVDQSKAQTEQLEAQAAKIRSETLEKDLNTAKMLADTRNVRANTGLTEESTANERQRNLGIVADSKTKHAVFEAMSAGGFTADVAKRKAEALLSQLEIPGAKADADFYSGAAGHASPYLKSILGILQGLNSAKSLAKPNIGPRLPIGRK